MSITKGFAVGLGGAVFATGVVFPQDYENINGALIYDYDPAPKISDAFFGTIICDFENLNLILSRSLVILIRAG